VQAPAGRALHSLQDFLGVGPRWLFGHFSYDLKNEMEAISSRNRDRGGFADLHFFEPEILLKITEDAIEITGEGAEQVAQQVGNTKYILPTTTEQLKLQERITRDEYIGILHRLKAHIQRGDCYEINFCQEFFSENSRIDPIHVFRRLCRRSPAPFSALYRVNKSWLICSSPERFLRKKDGRIFSQPMKGTASRGADATADQQQRTWLQASEKDRSENVMVVDLVRNDLSRVCQAGSVRVDELFGVYAYPQVWQMISTVSGIPRHGIELPDIIRASFPMGSMTGAPKKRVMELIEEYESFRRGIFSGSVGFVDPKGDFDFNVVIRSIIYNEQTGYISCPAGSGITIYSEPEKEWEECLLKAAAMRGIVESS
jgi:para-aminobenzoate synthetase component 1